MHTVASKGLLSRLSRPGGISSIDTWCALAMERPVRSSGLNCDWLDVWLPHLPGSDQLPGSLHEAVVDSNMNRWDRPSSSGCDRPSLGDDPPSYPPARRSVT